MLIFLEKVLEKRTSSRISTFKENMADPFDAKEWFREQQEQSAKLTAHIVSTPYNNIEKRISN